MRPLSWEATRLLLLMHRYYQTQRMMGTDVSIAIYTGSSRRIREVLRPGLSLSAIETACSELETAGLIRIRQCEGTVICSSLLQQGIAYAESRCVSA